jgi:hypothetical protein
MLDSLALGLPILALAQGLEALEDRSLSIRDTLS